MRAGHLTLAAMPAASAPWPVYLKLVGVAAIWGGTFVAGRIATAELPASTAALWRYVLASAVLVVAAFALERGLPRLTARQWLGVRSSARPVWPPTTSASCGASRPFPRAVRRCSSR